MNEWLVWLANPLDDLAGWPRFAFVVLWQSTTIAGLALLVVRTAQKPAIRAWILLLGIVAAVAAPIATIGVRAAGWGAASDASIATSGSGEPNITAVQPDDTGAEKDAVAVEVMPDAMVAAPIAAVPPQARIPNETTDFREIAEGIWASISSILSIAWIAISAIVSIRLVRSYVRMRRIVGRAEICRDPSVVAIVTRIAERYGILTPTVLLSDGVKSPAAFGISPGVVLVQRNDSQLFAPSGEFPSAAWEAVLRHELAHLRRRDPLCRMVVEALVALLPSPALWHMRRKFHAAAEEAADDWAVYDGTNAVDLAELLTTYVSKLSSNPIGSAMDSSDTKRRILRLLSTNVQVGTSPAGRWRGVLAASALTLVAAVAVAQKPPQDGDSDKSTDAANVAQANESNAKTATTDAAGAADVAAVNSQPYVIEPPDVLTIEVGKLVPISPHKIEKLDALQIVVEGTLVNAPVSGIYTVNTNGEVNLGPIYDKVGVAGLTEEEATAAVEKHLSTILREPRVALTIAQMSQQYHIEGQHLVGPDGNMNLGVFGQIHVSGLTLEQAKREIENKLLTSHFQQASIALDMKSYNSKAFYIIEDNREGGDRVTRFPITGNETVLDALATIETLRIRDGTQIWVTRKDKAGKQQKLVVDWDALVRGDDTKTNYTLLPGDRLFVAQPDAKPSGNGLQRR